MAKAPVIGSPTARVPRIRTPATAAADLADPEAVKVITYNTASGNSRYDGVPQAAFADLPMYQDIVQGKPGAAILAAQEVGNAQLARLQALSANGNFTVVDAPAKPGQHNMLLIPKRYQVLDAQSHHYVEGQARGFFRSLWEALTRGWKPTPFQLIEPRMYSEVKLRDRLTGRTLTVFNTHVSIDGPMRAEQLRELMPRIAQAQKEGPVLFAGDLNTRARSGNYVQDGYDEEIRSMLARRGLTDMGGPGAPGRNIDWVLASGFDPVSTVYDSGDRVQLPGFPNAHALSDHLAEEDVIRYR